MNNPIFEDAHLEKTLQAHFGLNVSVDTVIARDFPVSRTDMATLFLNEKKQLYLFVQGQSRLLLGDIRKIVSRVGLQAELYVPPKGRPHYFDEVATEKFKAVFPGRSHVTGDDLAYYKTLAPYNPALVLIREVKNGEVLRFDADAAGGWRIQSKFTYRRIKTS